MSALGWSLVAVVALAVILALVIAMQPAAFTVRRSASMAASPQAVFAQVNDFQKWRAWSPWVGNRKVGEGRMTITDSRTPERVLIDLVFIKPFAARNKTEFVFKPEGGGTVVTWSMTGHNNFMGKAFSLFANIDRMVGGQFEEGLSNLRTLVERHG